MTTTLNYFTLDVFTDRPFSGNPLAMSVPEDPATGAAAAALAGYLGGRQQGPGRWPMTIEQGIEMGRPSRILADARRDEEGVAEVSVAGQAVLTGEGNFRLGRALG